MEFVLIAVVLAGLDWAALRWGADSREDVNDPEWTRRQAWRGFSH